jgi:hypothetical protein
MHSDPGQLWPITVQTILRTLPVARMVDLATHYHIALSPDSRWEEFNAALLADRAVHTVPVLHLLTRFELGAVCRMSHISDEGPTQSVIAQLLPLCKPSTDAPTLGV